MKYKTEKEILRVVADFERGTIKRGAWGHPEHLILAYHYAKNNDFDSALKKMRDGIFNLLRAFKVDLSKEMPYHETLTVFWMRTVFEFDSSASGDSLVDNVHRLITTFDKHYPGKFYTHDLLFSDLARKEFVEPDLDELPPLINR